MQRVWNVKSDPAKRYPRTTEAVARDVRLVDVASNPRRRVEGMIVVEDPDSATAPGALNATLQAFIKGKMGPPPEDELEEARERLERRQKQVRSNYRSEREPLDGALARLEEQNIDLAILRVGLELDAAERRARARRAPSFFRSARPAERIGARGLVFRDFCKL